MVTGFFQNFHYRSKSDYALFDALLFIALIPFSIIYNLIIQIWLFLYSSKILKSHHPGVKVISIGNLTTGGTGKTPFVLELVKYLKLNTDFKIAILSRGYGKKKHGGPKITIVKTENNLLVNNPDECGDESFMLAEMLDNVTIITGQNRVKMAKEAVEKYNCNLIILDDGFQHLALARDHNIVLIDAEKMFGNNQILPLGPLREPISSLARANTIVLLMKNPLVSSLFYQPIAVSELQKPVINAKYTFDTFYKLPEFETLSELPSRKILAFSGIAQPDYFINLLEQQNLTVSEKMFYPDHHNYKDTDIENINFKAKLAKVEAIITTQKDAYKIIPLIPQFNLPVYTASIKITIDMPAMLESINFYEKTT